MKKDVDTSFFKHILVLRQKEVGMKEEYLKLLEAKLVKYNEETRKEILEDYEEHFNEGMAAGKSEDEIIRELGDIDDMLAGIPEDDFSSEEKKKSSVNNFNEDGYAGSFSKVEVEGMSADIEVRTSEDECIYVEFEGEGVDNGNPENSNAGFKLYQYEKNNTFYVGIRKNDNFQGCEEESGTIKDIFTSIFEKAFSRAGSSFNNIDGKLIISIPERIETISLKTFSGDISAEECKVKIIEIFTQSGDAKLEDIRCEKIRIETMSGDIEIDSLNTGRISASSMSGDIEANELSCFEGVFSSKSGDVEVNGEIINANCSSVSGDLKGEISSENLRGKTVSGDFNITFTSEPKNLFFESISGDVNVDFDSDVECKIVAKSVSGDISIEQGSLSLRTERSVAIGDGDTNLVASTVSGDISIG